MKRFTKFFTNHKTIWITIVSFLILFYLVSLLSFGSFGNVSHNISHINQWINNHKYIFIFWHILLLIAIYFAWGIKVDHAAKKQNLSKPAIIKAKRFRWVIIAAILVIDVLMHV